jgi:hypothetical protein
MLSTPLALYISMNLTKSDKQYHSVPGHEDVTIGNLVYHHHPIGNDDDPTTTTMNTTTTLNTTTTMNTTTGRRRRATHAQGVGGFVSRHPLKDPMVFMDVYREYLQEEGYYQWRKSNQVQQPQSLQELRQQHRRKKGPGYYTPLLSELLVAANSSWNDSTNHSSSSLSSSSSSSSSSSLKRLQLLSLEEYIHQIWNHGIQHDELMKLQRSLYTGIGNHNNNTNMRDPFVIEK